MERPYTQSDPIPTFQRAKETALSVLGDFWLLLADLFSVFTASPCVSVGFPPQLEEPCHINCGPVQIWSPSHPTVDYLRIQRYYGYCAANTGHAESSFFSPYNPNTLNNHHAISSIEMKQYLVMPVIHSLILQIVSNNGNCQALLIFPH